MNIVGVESLVDRVKMVREASYVDRCHTHMKIGSYMISFHTFNMLTLLRILYPDCRVDLVWATLEHDIPERLVGDVPRQAKKHILNVQGCDDLELEINQFLFGSDSSTLLTVEEKKWLAGLDVLEFYMYCRDQLSMGNKNFNAKIASVLKLMTMCRHLFPREINDLFWALDSYPWDYLPDLENME